MKTFLLKLLFKIARRGWSKHVDTHIPDYAGTRRQWAALVAGFFIAGPILIAVLVFQLFSVDFTDLAHAAHAPAGVLIVLLLLAIGAIALLLNYGTPVLAVFVIGSLAYDLYMLRNWRNSKFFALCIGTAALASSWCWLAAQTNEFIFISLADLAPFLSSALALLLTFTTLLLLPKPRTGL